jgi:hypothetical protein
MSPTTVEQDTFKKSRLIFHAVTISDHDEGKESRNLEI